MPSFFDLFLPLPSLQSESGHTPDIIQREKGIDIQDSHV
jgi:hypothetical protein